MELIVEFDFSEILDMSTGNYDLYNFLGKHAEGLLEDEYPEYNLNFFDIQLTEVQLEDEKVVVIFNAERNDIGRR